MYVCMFVKINKTLECDIPIHKCVWMYVNKAHEIAYHCIASNRFYFIAQVQTPTTNTQVKFQGEK